MNAINARIVVVGGGHGGGNVVALLRQAGHVGELQMVCDESLPPYHRPPLSKAFLTGEADLASLKLRADDFYMRNNIALRLGVRVTAIDAAQRVVELDSGAHLDYDILILATGSVARKLSVPGADLGGVHHLRSVADAEGFRTALGPRRRLAIIGGGYIGLEAAASARGLGAEAVVIEREPRVLARVACEPLSAFFQDYHSARGVEFITGASVDALVGNGAAFVSGVKAFVSGVKLSDGRVVACDAVLVGVGGSPCDELATAAGINCAGGVVVDLAARTSVPGIYAIGDMTLRPLPHYGDRRLRLESVPNALDQAKAAVADILGKPAPTPDLPWFWSDQFDLKLQIAGIAFDVDDIVIRGAPADAKFAIYHFAGDRVVAVEAINSAADFMGGKKMIANRTVVDRARLADTSVSVKELAA